MRSVNDPIRQNGAAAIIVAAALVALMGMAAIVVDGGAGFSERRQAQSGADFGTLAAAQFSNPANIVPQCPPGMDADERAACRGAVEAIDVVTGNLPSAELDWLNCHDPEHLSLLPSVDFGSGLREIECVSFSDATVDDVSTTQNARVKVPTVGVDTTFGRVLGVDSLSVAAFAEVHASLPEASLILPFGIPANAERFDCLKSSSHPDWGVCNGGGAEGNYGYLDVPTYGNPDLGTTFSNCTTPNPTLLSNMIKGVDHPLGTHVDGTRSAADPGLSDGNSPYADTINVCPIFGSNANEVNVQTGVVQSIFEQGLTYGFGSSERGPMWGALEWKSGNMGNPAVNLDDTPLWAYLTTGSFCPSGSLPTNTQGMVDCLKAWTPSDGIVFSEDITSNMRYAFAPRLWSNFGTGSDWHLIELLQPIYLNTSYWGCNASGDCDGIHSPGDLPGPIGPCIPPPEPYTGDEPADATCADSLPLSHSVGLNAVASFNLERGMLPDAALHPVEADGPLLNFALTK